MWRTSAEEEIKEPATRKLVKLVSDIDELKSKLDKGNVDVLETESTGVAYLDERKTMCLLKATKLQSLQNQLREAKRNCSTSNKQLAELQAKIQRLHEEREQAEKRLLFANEELENERKIVFELREEGRQQFLRESFGLMGFLQNQKEIKVEAIPIQSLPEEKLMEDASVQTEYWVPKLELVTVVQAPAKTVQKEVRAQMQLRLEEVIASYEQQFQALEQALNKKVAAISDQHLDVQEWVHKNEILEAENRELKQRMQTIELEKARVLLWREKVESRMKQFENGLMAPLPMPTVSSIIVDMPAQRNNFELQNTFLKSEVQRLRNQLMEKKLSASITESSIKLAEVFRDEPKENTDTPEEGTIGRLASLSQKIRATAKWLTSTE